MARKRHRSIHFARLWPEQGIEHRRTKPYTPKTNGLVERTNGLIKEGTSKQHTYENALQMQHDLVYWFVRYNLS